MWLRRVRWVASFAAALLYGAALGARMLADFDLPWHLAWGRGLAAARAVPRIDDFAYTHTPVTYVGLLGDALLYAIERAGGELGLQVFGAAMGLALVALVAVRARGAGLLAIAIVTLAAVALAPWILVRPATMSFVFFALELALLDLHRAAPEAASGRRALLALPWLFAIWANTHGAGTLGLALLGAYAAERLITRAPGARLAAMAGVASAAATTLNPWGVAYLTGAARVLPYGDLVTEWAATTPAFFVREAPAAGAALLLCLAAIAAGREAEGRRAPSLWDGAQVLIACALATRIRLVPYALVVLAPIAARRAAAALVAPRRSHQPPPLASPALASPPLRTARPSALLAGVLPLAALFAGPAVLAVDATTLGVGFDPRHFPEPAVRFVETLAPEGRMWNFAPFGGYLIWRLYPRHRVLMDGRIGFVHDDATIRLAHASDVDPAAFAALDAQYHFGWAMCRAREDEAHCLPIAASASWSMVFWDDVSAVYVRQRDGAPRDAYRMLRHDTAMEAALRFAQSPDGRAVAFAADAARAVAQDPASARATFLDACAGIATRDAPRFRAARARLARLSPENTAATALDAAWPEVTGAR